jgi:ribokinase
MCVNATACRDVRLDSVRVAVVGHVEWVDFLHVERAPHTGEIVQAGDSWQAAAGGGADAAVQLAKLAGSASLYTALGDDELGRRALDELTARGVHVETVWRNDPQRRAVCFLDSKGERTIALLRPKLVAHGEEPLPWGELEDADGVYFCGGDAAALRAARTARALVASARELPVLREAGVEVDVLVGSARDEAERYDGGLAPAPRYVVRTEGAEGGTVEPGGRFAAAPVPGPLVDTYGAGDAFAAGLTFGLASGLPIDGALELAARCGAAVLTGRGPYEAQLTL